MKKKQHKKTKFGFIMVILGAAALIAARARILGRLEPDDDESGNGFDDNY